MRELGVDVRARAHDDVEAELVREPEECAHIALGIAGAEIEHARRSFVDAPRHVGVDGGEAQLFGLEQRGRHASRASRQ